ncbi:MAG: hypothetical protein DRP57_06295 [Spirochaetes bacterium]|nr:MAG: hypothetical protein DRP57_06295 [Spirochaetota bacterium]
MHRNIKLKVILLNSAIQPQPGFIIYLTKPEYYIKLNVMELSQKQIERLIQIIQQYAVIYGGGISTKDARVREECEDLVKSLSAIIKTSRRGKNIALKTTAETGLKDKKKRTQEPAKSKDSSKGALESAAPVSKPVSDRKKTLKKTAESPTTLLRDIAGKSAKKTIIKAKPAGKKSRRKIQAIHLFDAYNNAKLPKYGGYIVSSNFQAESNYSIFEIVGYDNVQEIRLESDSLIFKSAGCKLYTLIEPPNYPLKNVEPVQRQSGKSIPYRFSELYILTTKKHETIYIGKKPIISYSSFTIVKPRKNDFAILFYNVPEVFKNIEEFLTTIYHDGVGISKTDSQKAAKITVQGIKNFNTWLDL